MTDDDDDDVIMPARARRVEVVLTAMMYGPVPGLIALKIRQQYSREYKRRYYYA